MVVTAVSAILRSGRPHKDVRPTMHPTTAFQPAPKRRMRSATHKSDASANARMRAPQASGLTIQSTATITSPVVDQGNNIATRPSADRHSQSARLDRAMRKKRQKAKRRALFSRLRSSLSPCPVETEHKNLAQAVRSLQSHCTYLNFGLSASSRDQIHN